MMKYQCPCCGDFTYNVPANEDCGYICPICFWENDPFIASDNEPSDSSAFVDWRWTKMKNDTIFLYLIASVSFLFCSNCAGRHNKTVEFGLAAQNGGFEITISEPPFSFWKIGFTVGGGVVWYGGVRGGIAVSFLLFRNAHDLHQLKKSVAPLSWCSNHEGTIYQYYSDNIFSCARAASCRPGVFASIWSLGPTWTEVQLRCRSPSPLFRLLVNTQHRNGGTQWRKTKKFTFTA